LRTESTETTLQVVDKEVEILPMGQKNLSADFSTQRNNSIDTTTTKVTMVEIRLDDPRFIH
jgi:hypothetical protein